MAIDLTLPSGVRARVTDAAPEKAPVRDDSVDAKRAFGGRMLRVLSEGRLVVELEGEVASLERIDQLSLRDYHALRDAAFRLGVVDEEPDPDLRCRNCDEPLAPERGDMPVGELDRWYVEHPEEPLEPPFPFARAIRLANGVRASDFVMKPVTVKQAKPLWRLLERDDGAITPKIVDALGIEAFGDVTDRRVIARTLGEASDEAWAVIETAFLLLNYAARSHYPYVCPKCGTLHDVLAPATREFDLDPDAEALLLAGELPDADGAPPFPDEDAFAEMALRIGRDVYRERGVANIELVVDDGVPPVDGSGEPLMGSYRPIAEGDHAGYTDLRFQIDVYYKTFEKMYEEAPFDVEAELRDTIDHEVEHHLHYLSGHDPMDEEEREEALAELQRTYGARAVRRAQAAGILAELRTLSWFMLAAAIVVGVIALFLVGCGGAGGSTPAPGPRPSGDPRVGTYVSSPRGFETSSYFIEGPEGVVVIDTQFMPSEARALLERAEAETGKPVVLAIVLHANPDKFNGTEVFERRGIRVVTSDQVCALIPEVDELRRGWFYERYAPDYPEETPSPECFGSETTTLEAGGLALRAHVLGPGVSGAHVVVEWEGHVFAGDLVANGNHGWLELGLTGEWLARLDEIAAMDPRRVHPGRGPSGGPELIAKQRAYIERVLDLVREAEPRLPIPAGAIESLRARIVEEYPGYGYDVFLRVGLPAVYTREAEAITPRP